ncbi:pyruvate,orthophosphate dikinase [Actimicrobium sp. GrIS 1.19]|uniref:PEP/pyruvate-binding domain-containing protein n=1 Tax=Actimicrobium sp. GrIS 1.19 TaxID=3071708 RepID=UPI002E028386|nr:pyruvate,orthophosphate dikinase [Actimicrobium sp. GrIS 1.19]
MKRRHRHSAAAVRLPMLHPFPRAADRVRAAPVAPVARQLPWPDEMYLIDGTTPAPPGASATSMGFKGWNLLRMAQLGLPVPPAFVLGTHYCLDAEARTQAATAAFYQPGLQSLERASGLAFGDAARPLLLSVRSGAPVSMPGMMETLLNIGLCDRTVVGLLRQTGNPRLVWDAYRRLVASHGEVVAGLPAKVFEDASTALFGERDERELDFMELRAMTERFLAVYADAAGTPFPQDPGVQLRSAIQAVLQSWQSDKARSYRRMNGIDDAIGTAVTVQRMVFGNAGGLSGAGVGFTRDPASGAPGLWVDFLFNAQGEDVVSGRRSAHGHQQLAAVLPQIWQALQDAAHLLERAFGDMQDIEFTVQEGSLFMLQTRTGKRTALAAARIALDLCDEGVIDAATARARTAGLDRTRLAQPRVVAAGGATLTPLALAAAASNGVAIGEIALDEARARVRHDAGAAVILVRRDAETSDLVALNLAEGLLTACGARTSHAAVVARQLGKVCLVGCTALQIDAQTRTVTIGKVTVREGDLITLDGDSGAVYAGSAGTEITYPDDLLARLARLRDTAPA